MELTRYPASVQINMKRDELVNRVADLKDSARARVTVPGVSGATARYR
jgi:hypothetical protein